jgi:hypothetical protein
MKKCKKCEEKDQTIYDLRITLTQLKGDAAFIRLSLGDQLEQSKMELKKARDIPQSIIIDLKNLTRDLQTQGWWF